MILGLEAEAHGTRHKSRTVVILVVPSPAAVIFVVFCFSIH